MEEKKIDQIVDVFFEVIPVIMQTKRLLHNRFVENLEKTQLKIRIMEPHMRIMMILSKSNDITMTSLSKHLIISKPNVTTLIENLFDLEFVERISDPKDRRLVYIKLTRTGFKFIENYMNKLKGEIKERLNNFTDDDLDSYISTLQNMKYFTSKLNSIYDKI